MNDEVDARAVNELGLNPLAEVALAVDESSFEPDPIRGVRGRQRRDDLLGQVGGRAVAGSPDVYLDPRWVQSDETFHVLRSIIADRLQRDGRQRRSLRSVDPVDARSDQRGDGRRGYEPGAKGRLPVHLGYSLRFDLNGAAQDFCCDFVASNKRLAVCALLHHPDISGV